MVSKGKAAVAVLLALLVALTLTGSVACAGSGTGGGGSSSAVSPADKAAQILGHEPAGLAKTIVDAGELVVANDADYAPQSSKNEAGRLEGFDVDVANLVGQALGLKVVFVNPKWDAVVSGLQKGRWDVSIGSMSITPELSRVVDFADPYAYTEAQLLVKSSSPAIRTIDQLTGKKISVGAQTTYQTFLDTIGGVDVICCDADADAFSALENGDVDGAVTAAQTANETVLSGKPFELSGKPFYYQPLAFAIAKDDTDLLALLNYSIKWMRDNGRLSGASKKWYHGFDVTQAPAPGVPSYDEVMAQLKEG